MPTSSSARRSSTYRGRRRRVIIFHGSPSGPCTWVAPARTGRAEFGAPSRGRDVNGDGYSDVIVGAPYYDNGQTRGGAFVTCGSPAASRRAHAECREQPGVVAVRLFGRDGGTSTATVLRRHRRRPYYDNGQTDEGVPTLPRLGRGPRTRRAGPRRKSGRHRPAPRSLLRSRRPRRQRDGTPTSSSAPDFENGAQTRDGAIFYGSATGYR